METFTPQCKHEKTILVKKNKIRAKRKRVCETCGKFIKYEPMDILEVNARKRYLYLVKTGGLDHPKYDRPTREKTFLIA